MVKKINGGGKKNILLQKMNREMYIWNKKQKKREHKISARNRDTEISVSQLLTNYCYNIPPTPNPHRPPLSPLHIRHAASLPGGRYTSG